MPLLLEEDLKRPLPKMYRVRQSFNKEHLEDIEGTVAREFAKAEIRAQVKPGMRVALAVGSRGIRNLSRIVKCVVDQLLALGAEPFIVAAMGSHGGGTLEGQLEILHTYGITQEAMGIPVIANNDVELLGSTSRGIQVYFDKLCLEQADLVIPINRVKTHTSFKGCVESGLCKKLVVGLGGPGGAGQFHSLGQAELPRLLVEVTKVILGKMPVLGGVAIVENAYEETARIKAIPAEALIEEEIRLLAWSKSLMPALPTDRLHGLIVEEMGKNFSGTGVDTNIIGRLRITGEPEMESPRIRYVSVLDLSEASHGNATGVGLVDFVTRRLVDKIDRKATYLNNLTTTFVTRAFTPLWFDTDREMLETMMFCLRSVPLAETRLILIPNTLYLADCYVSEAILPELADTGRFEVVGPLRELAFDAQGNLILRIGLPRTS